MWARNEKAAAFNKKNKTSYGKMGVFNCPNNKKAFIDFFMSMNTLLVNLKDMDYLLLILLQLTISNYFLSSVFFEKS